MTRILLTRPTAESEKSRPLFEAAGFEVLIQPALEILPPDDWSAADIALNRLSDGDWLIFSSANGVRFFCGRAATLGVSLEKCRVAAVGPATAEAARTFHLAVDCIPQTYCAEGLVDALTGEASGGGRFFSVRGDRGRDILKTGLSAAGGTVDEITVYRSTEVLEADAGIVAELAAGRIDYTVATSPAVARSLVRLFGDALNQTRLASISPLTSAAFRSAGYSVDVEAADASMEGIFDAIRRP